MSHQNYPNPDDLYQQALEHFNRGEWQAATAAFTELQTLSDAYPGVDALVADARLKAHFEGAVQPTAKAPPRQKAILPLAIVAIVALIAGVGYLGMQVLDLFSPAPVEAVVLPTEVATLPTALIAPPTAVPVPTQPPAPTPVTIISGTVAVVPAEGTQFVTMPANVQFIIDASGSMLAEMPGTGKRRWEVAQEALNAMVMSGAIPLESRVGVRTFGRNRGNDCSDQEVAHAMEHFSLENVLNTIREIKPSVGGMAPIGASLRAAAQDLESLEGSSIIVLVTDGLDSCDGDPVAEAELFVRGGSDRRVHVVGFAVDTPGANAQLKDIAARGNGLYFDADDAEDMSQAIQQAVVLTYRIMTPDGMPVAAGTVGDPPTSLDAGSYVLRINARPPIERELVVADGTATEVRLSQSAGVLTADMQSSQPE